VDGDIIVNVDTLEALLPVSVESFGSRSGPRRSENLVRVHTLFSAAEQPRR